MFSKLALFFTFFSVTFGAHCSNYCTDIMATCDDGDADHPKQYDSFDECMGYCKVMERGPLSQVSTDIIGGNSLACRAYHLSVAGSTQGAGTDHCSHAGPTGGGVCVDNGRVAVADLFCSAYQSTCAENPEPFWETHEECYQDYIGFRDTDEQFAGVTSGNSQQCRFYHLGAAFGDASTHCAHAGFNPTVACVDTLNPTYPTDCASYCSTMGSTCTGDDAQYTNEAECLNYCAYMQNGYEDAKDLLSSNNGTLADTFSCRAYHLWFADNVGAADPAGKTTHCDHAGLWGGSENSGFVCTTIETSTTVFCRALINECNGMKEAFSDNGATVGGAISWSTAMEACVAEYSQYPDVFDRGVKLETAGHSQMCRAYHLAVAMDSGDNVHCDHAGPLYNGGAACQPDGTQTSTFPNWSSDKVECADYCSSIMSTCTGSDAQYDSEDECLNYCAWLPTGGSDDGTGNSLQCRNYHAGVAASVTDPADVTAHCSHASLLGGGVCGSIAEGFCNAYQGTCGATSEFSSDNECAMVMEALVQSGGRPAGAGVTSGPTMECRVYHLGVAMTQSVQADIDFHCGHASLEGDNVCGFDTCASYCANYVQTCGLYNSEAECLNYCQYMPKGDVDGMNTQSENTLSCRSYHLGVAQSSADQADVDAHCTHSGPFGGGVCGGASDLFCNAADWTPVCANGPYIDCAEQTKDMDKLERSGLTAGDSLNCRFYHLGVAMFGGDSIHCDHASASGAGVCVGPITPTPTPTPTPPPSPTPVAPADCNRYCNKMMSTCTDPKLFTTKDECLAYCEYFPQGTIGDVSGFSLECAWYHLGVADAATDAAEVRAHCYHAGPYGGDGVCGVASDLFCAAMDDFCPSNQYSNCANDVDGLPFLFSSDGSQTSSDTFDCRFYHLGFGMITNQDSHCAHADLDGGGVCAAPDRCVEYCDEFETGGTCDDLQSYINNDDCIRWCREMPVGREGDIDVNSLSCREYHIGVAKTSSDSDRFLHCSHAALEGGNQCGAPGDMLCTVMDSFCAGYIEEWFAISNCYTKVAEYTETADGRTGGAVTSGDSLECRYYHLAFAMTQTDQADQKEHCLHAGPTGLASDGSEVCAGDQDTSTSADSSSAPEETDDGGDGDNVADKDESSASVMVAFISFFVLFF